MAETPKIGLHVLEPGDTSMTVMEWVEKMGSSADTSNMMILDRHVAGLKEDKADKVVQSDITPEDVDAGDDWDQLLGDSDAPFYKNISVETDIVGGNVAVSKTLGLVGETVSVAATPNRGYALDSILVDGEALTENHFIISGDHVVSATFVEGSLAERFFPGQIVLSQDEEVDTSIVLSEPGEYVLDFNGHKLNSNVAPLFVVADGASLFVMSSTGYANMESSEDGTEPVLIVQSGGVLCWNDVAWRSAGSTESCIYNEGSVLLESGYIESVTGGTAVVATPKSSVVVSGFSIECFGRGISTTQACQSHNDFPTVSISSGSFIHNSWDLSLETAFVTIAGGLLKSMTPGVPNVVLTGCNTAITGGFMQSVQVDSCVVANNEYSVLNISGSSVIAELTALSGTRVIGNLTENASVFTTSKDTVLHLADQNVAVRDVGDGQEYFYSLPYSITTTQAEGGTITVLPTLVQQGRQVTVTAVADTGYLLKHVLVDGVAIEGNTFVASSDHVVSALFERLTLPTSGNLQSGVYMLQGDVQLAGTLIASADVDAVIDLCGHTISMVDDVSTGFFRVAAAGKLTVADSVGGGLVQFKQMTSSGGISVAGTFVLDGGELTGWSRQENDILKAGGFIDLLAGATFVMTGGVITGITAASNSVIRSHGAGVTVDITGGEISGNESSNGSIIGVGKAGGQSWLNIGGEAVIRENTMNGEVVASTYTQIYAVETIVNIGEHAFVEANVEANLGAGETAVAQESSQINITGHPYVQYVRVDSPDNTLLTITELEDGAEIRMSQHYAVEYDGSVDVAAVGDDYCYTYQEVRDDLIVRHKFRDGETLTLSSDSEVDDDGIVFKPGVYTLDLAGHTLTGTAVPYFTIGAGVELVVIDSVGGGKIVGLENAANAMILVDGGRFELAGGLLTGNVNSSYGGAIYAQSAGSYVCISGGEISGNTAYRGGAISGPDTASAVDVTILITDGVVSGNVTNRGATIYTQTGATVVIEGGKVGYGTIEGDLAYGHSGTEDLWLRNSWVELFGGDIHAVWCDLPQEEYDILIQGAPTIGYIKFSNGAFATISNLIKGAMVYSGGAISYAEEDSSVAETCFADRYVYAHPGPYQIVTETVPHGTLLVRLPGGDAGCSSMQVAFGTTVEVVGSPDVGYIQDGITVDGNAISNNSFVVLRDGCVSGDFAPYNSSTLMNTSVLPTGVCTLDSNVFLTHTPIINSEVVIDLAGHAITGSVFPYFYIQSGGVLTLRDSTTNGQVVGGAKSGDSIFRVSNGGTLLIEGGTIQGHNNTSSGPSSGGVVNTQGDVMMSGGTISGNTTNGYGGAIHVGKGGTFTMTGGEISGNTAYRGGAISTSDVAQAWAKRIEISGSASIVRNIATNRAATIYVQQETELVIKGGTIGSGYVLDSATGEYVNATTFYNAWIRSAAAVISGGTMDNIYYISQMDGASLAITGNPVIDGLFRASAEWTTISALTYGARIVWHQEFVNGDTTNPTQAPVTSDDTIKTATVQVVDEATGENLDVVTYTYQ